MQMGGKYKAPKGHKVPASTGGNKVRRDRRIKRANRILRILGR